MSGREPTVFVVDDDKGVLDSVRLLLRSVGLKAATFPSAADFLEAYDPDTPGCLVLDVRMQGMSGLKLQQCLAERAPALPIIFLTAHGDIPMAVEAVKAGAIDFIQKPFRDQTLLDKIHHAIELNTRVREEATRQAQVRNRIASLTPRELEVMDLVLEGKGDKVIARDLGISQRTVEIHRARVMQEMQVSTVSQLVQAVMGRKAEGGS